MKRFFATAALALLATPASAQMVDEYCNDYWFVRNQAFDQAGYCFGSALGQALFDNSNCQPGAVTLRPENQALVARITQLEAEGGCHVDSSATSLPIPLIGLRLQLEDLAARDDTSGAACYGWQGPGFMLWAGHAEQGVPLSEVRAGDDLFFLYYTPEAPAGWGYLEVLRDGVPVGLGWSNAPLDWALCDEAVG